MHLDGRVESSWDILAAAPKILAFTATKVKSSAMTELRGLSVRHPGVAKKPDAVALLSLYI